jgi:hypothetical protein
LKFADGRHALPDPESLALTPCAAVYPSPLLAGAAAWPASPPGPGASGRALARPLRFIVGFPAGSSPDLTARALAEPLEKALGQPVVENRSARAATSAPTRWPRPRTGTPSA